MGEVFLRHEVVGLDNFFNIVVVDTNSNAHDHLLRSFGNLFVQTQQVGTFQGLETEILIIEVAVVDDGRVQLFSMLHDRLVCFLRNHGCWLIVFGIDVVKEVIDD